MPSRPNVSRRSLFRLRSQGPASGTAAPELERLNGGDLLLAHRPAMGSFFEVRLPARLLGGATLAQDALDLIDDLERQLTIYRDDSEVSRLNATAHRGPVAVEPGLFDLLQRAVRLYEETAGAVDVASGALSHAWGFVRGPKRVPTAGELAAARARSGSDLLRLDPRDRTIAFDRPGVVLNLGAIGKGYAIDRVVAAIRAYWFPTPALVHGGRSSLYAIGGPPDDLLGRWKVAVRNPFDPSRPVGTLHLSDRGLATSGPAFQSFEEGGRLYSHILDPRRGVPLGAEAPASVTVLAPTAAEADALSTAFSVLGPAGSEAILGRRPDVGALFVTSDEEGGPRLLACNLNPDDFTPDDLARGPGSP